MPKKMATFDLNTFLTNPSLSQIETFRKDELAQIAVYFGLHHMIPSHPAVLGPEMGQG